jgi:monodechloroaminopyrrolnitrin synthase
MGYGSSNLAIQHWLLNNESIVSIDPLGFDDKIVLLHKLNREKNTKDIVQFLYKLLPYPATLENYGYEESIAAMRDLGFVLGILKKHGIEPVEVVPELEYVLLVLMVKTDLPPRDTLLHYTVWNPSGERLRTYTGLKDEVALIESVKIALPSLMEAIVQLESVHEQKLSGQEFEKNCQTLREKMEGMVRAVVHAKKNVSPEVFSNELRFYFDPIKVDYAKPYIGPGAVEMPMFLFDHLLWSSDCNNSEYSKFKEGYLPYNLRFIREIYWKFNEKPSLVTRVLTQLQEQSTEEHFSAAQAVLDLCTVLKSFRMPHKKMAEEAYKHNDEAHRDKGSGGYSVNILQHIINLQNERIGALQGFVQEKKPVYVLR